LATERFEPDDQHDGPDDQPVDTPGDRPDRVARPRIVPREPRARTKERTISPVHARLTAVVVTLLFAGLVLGADVHLMVQTPDPVKRASGIGFLTALLVLQLAYFNRVSSRPGPD